MIPSPSSRFRWLPTALGIPWLLDSSFQTLTPSSHHLPFCDCVLFSYKDTVIGFRAYPDLVWSHLNPYHNSVSKDTISLVIFWGSGRTCIVEEQYSSNFIFSKGKLMDSVVFLVLPFLTSMMCLPQIKFSRSGSGLCFIPLIYLFLLHHLSYDNLRCFDTL